MLAFTRLAMARRFLAVAAKCSTRRPRPPDPAIVLRTTGDTVTLTAHFPEVVLELAAPAPTPSSGNAELIVPARILREVEGPTDDVVGIQTVGVLKGTISWPVGSGTRSDPIDLIRTGHHHAPLPRPNFTPMPARLLTALQECGRSTARDDGRFALSRIQVRGKHGHVIGTDGKAATIVTQLPFHFVEDVLVPAIPVFGCPEFRRETAVGVGRTASHLVVSVGPFTIWLSIATGGRYPDVASVVPRQATTTVNLDDTDVAALLAVLPKWPGADDDNRPVTVDAGEVLALRAGDPTIAGGVRELVLARSVVSGAATHTALDRRILGRALALGCRRLLLTPEKPLVLASDEVTVVVAGLTSECLVPPVPHASRTTTADVAVSTPSSRNSTMKPHETNGRPPTPRPGSPPPSLSPIPPDPAAIPDALAEAEALRQVLAEAASRAARLVAILKAGKKRERALENVWASLGQLRPGGGP